MYFVRLCASQPSALGDWGRTRYGGGRLRHRDARCTMRRQLEGSPLQASVKTMKAVAAACRESIDTMIEREDEAMSAHAGRCVFGALGRGWDAVCGSADRVDPGRWRSHALHSRCSGISAASTLRNSRSQRLVIGSTS